MGLSESTTKETLPPSKESDSNGLSEPRELSDSQEVADLEKGADLDEGADSDSDKDCSDKDEDTYKDEDSDAEWELEEENGYEVSFIINVCQEKLWCLIPACLKQHSVDPKFKATIHVTDIS